MWSTSWAGVTRLQSLAVLAQRVRGDVGVADSAPAMVVAFIDLRVTLVDPVALVFSLGVSWAEPVVGEFLGIQGWEQGRFGFLGTTLTSAEMV